MNGRGHRKRLAHGGQQRPHGPPPEAYICRGCGEWVWPGREYVDGLWVKPRPARLMGLSAFLDLEWANRTLSAVYGPLKHERCLMFAENKMFRDAMWLMLRTL